MEATIEENELMATISALDKESALALLAIAQAAPDNDTIADVWVIYDMFKSLGGNTNWAHFLYLLRKLEKLGLIKTVKLYRGNQRRSYSKNVMLTFRPSYGIIRELTLATDAQVELQNGKYANSDLTLVSFKLPVSLNATLSKAAKSLGVSKSELIRRALEAGLEYVENTGRLPPCVCNPYERMVVCSAKVPTLLLKEIDNILMDLDINRSEFIRSSAFYYYVTSVGKPVGGDGHGGH
jgi:metal-responsive CopG/Arc/MetJ family transcriptional regulator